MMRLVIEHTVGDGCSWHAINTIPVEYESSEAFVVEFEEACEQARDRLEFTFAGKVWGADNFFEDGVYYPPEVLTVDEWFNRSY